MTQCLRITFTLEKLPKNFLHSVVQKEAQKLGLEGAVQIMGDNLIRIIVCGKKEAVDQFIDFLHHKTAKEVVSSIEMEPFIRQKDYRGVFRVIE